MEHEEYLIDRRKIVSGVGDRLANLLCVAALARAHGMGCVVQWSNDPAQPHRQYDWRQLFRHMGLPRGVHVVDCVESFDAGQAARVDLRTEGNALPATNAYDCVYTLASRALAIPGRSVGAVELASGFRSVCAEWTIDPPHYRPPPFARYVALHLRGQDKRTPTLAFHTPRLLARLLPGMPVAVISDDPDLLRWFSRRFPGLWAGDEIADHTLSVVRDLKTLAGACGIVQHSAHGWSAFSSVVAMARGIPLLNTYAWRRRNLLADFERRGGLPPELRSSTAPRAIADFVATVQAGAG